MGRAALAKKAPRKRGFMWAGPHRPGQSLSAPAVRKKSRASRRVDTGLKSQRFGDGANQLRSVKCRLRVKSRYPPMAVAQLAKALRARV
jgi:hypothetical protein